MRIAVVSDIHANMDALTAVLKDISGLGVGRIISLGDNIGYGPEPDAVMAALARYNIDSVMGNHERALVDETFCRAFNSQARKALEINRALLPDPDLARIERLPVYLLARGARFVHGLPPDQPDRYVHKQSLTRLEHIMAAQPERLTFVGHTHRLALYESGPQGLKVKKNLAPRVFLAKSARYIINSGSVGQPRDGGTRAVYMIWDTEKQWVAPRFVTYNPARTVRLMAACGIPEIYRDLIAPEGSDICL